MAALKATSAMLSHAVVADRSQTGRSAPSEPGFIDALADTTQEVPKAETIGSKAWVNDSQGSASAIDVRAIGMVPQALEDVPSLAGPAAGRVLAGPWLSVLADRIPDPAEGSPVGSMDRHGEDAATATDDEGGLPDADALLALDAAVLPTGVGTGEAARPIGQGRLVEKGTPPATLDSLVAAGTALTAPVAGDAKTMTGAAATSTTLFPAAPEIGQRPELMNEAQVQVVAAGPKVTTEGMVGIPGGIHRGAGIETALAAIPVPLGAKLADLAGAASHDSLRARALGMDSVDAWLHPAAVSLFPTDAFQPTCPIDPAAGAGYMALEFGVAPAAPVGGMLDEMGLGLGSAPVASQVPSLRHNLADGVQDDPGAAESGHSGQVETLHQPGSSLQGGDQRHADDQLLSGPFTQVSTPAAARVSTAHVSLPPAMAEQVVAAVEAMSHSRSPSGRVTVSITPDELGRIGITVERQANGTTTIHVQAERLATLDLLRTDQAALVRALDQSGHHGDGNMLSFSWDNGSGHSGRGGAAWGLQDEHQGGPASNTAPGRLAYTDARSSLTLSAAARGGVDVTA